jgi:hypothetical protein
MLTEKQLVDLMVGIAKTQVAVAGALGAQNDLAIQSRIQSSVGALTGARRSPPPITFENLGAHLLLKALLPPRPQGETIEQLAEREVHRLLFSS